jgi:hypothetical protein
MADWSGDVNRKVTLKDTSTCGWPKSGHDIRETRLKCEKSELEWNSLKSF